MAFNFTATTGEKGFTLLEVMIAVAILAISLTSLFGSQSASVALVTESRFNVQAPLLAKKQLAELIAADEIYQAGGDFGEEFPGFQWELVVEEAYLGLSEVLQQLDGRMWNLKMTVTCGEDALFSYELDTYRKKEE